jgi:Ca2+-binding EF-hand superfamily protein
LKEYLQIILSIARLEMLLLPIDRNLSHQEVEVIFAMFDDDKNGKIDF